MIPVNITSSETIINVITNEENIIGSASPREIFIFLLLVIAAYIIGIIITYFLKIRFSHKLKKDQLHLITRIIEITLILLALGIAVPGLFDLSLTVLVLVIAGALAVIGFSSQKVISNFTCGLTLLYERPYSTGDYISIGDISGTVESIRLLSVLIRTTSGVFAWLPVEKVYDFGLYNYHANVARRYEYEVGIRYQDNADDAIRIIKGILDSYTFVLKNPSPEVFVSAIDVNSILIKFRVWFPSVWANTKDDISLGTEILPRVKAGLESAGIEIPYAQRVIWFANKPPSQK